MEENSRQGHRAMEEKVQIYEKSRYKEKGLRDMATSSGNKKQPCPLYSFFWVIPRRPNVTCLGFGTLCLFHLHRWCDRKNDWHPSERTQHSEHGESCKSRITQPCPCFTIAFGNNCQKRLSKYNRSINPLNIELNPICQ